MFFFSSWFLRHNSSLSISVWCKSYSSRSSHFLCICIQVKYESVVHEFDPYFNYKVTQYLTKNGIYDFWNWFYDRTWYSLGRLIGGTKVDKSEILHRSGEGS